MDYTFSFSCLFLEYTTFHCLALESQLHKKKMNVACFTVLKNVFYPLALMMIFSPAQEIGNIQWNHSHLIPVLHSCSPACLVICLLVSL